MRIELANDQWIEIRDRIKGGDIFAVQDAGKIPLDEEGRTTEISYQGIDARQIRALALRVITGWSFQVPLPQSYAQAASVIDDLDEDDYWKLHAELRPRLDKIKAGGAASGGSENPKTDGTQPTS